MNFSEFSNLTGCISKVDYISNLIENKEHSGLVILEILKLNEVLPARQYGFNPAPAQPPPLPKDMRVVNPPAGQSPAQAMQGMDQGQSGGPPIMPTPWGTHEAPDARKIQSMQSEAGRISGQQGFSGDAQGAGLSEFYNQFPWMSGPGWENENMYFNELVNPSGSYGVPMGQEQPFTMDKGEALPGPKKLF